MGIADPRPGAALAERFQKGQTAGKSGWYAANGPRQGQGRREDAMPLLIALGFFVGITVLVLLGSQFFGPDSRLNKSH
jgi:hypothetical protein